MRAQRKKSKLESKHSDLGGTATDLNLKKLDDEFLKKSRYGNLY